MNDDQKSEALGGLVGGALAGGGGVKGIRIPIPKFEPVPQLGGSAAIELAISQVVVLSGRGLATAGGLAGSGSVAMMTGSDAGDSTDNKADEPLKPPADRHFVKKVKQSSVAKNKNSVVEPWVDVKADVEKINSGLAVKTEDKFIVSGRTYGQHDGTLYPISGPGVHQLDRGAFKALGVYNKFGDTPQSEGLLNNMKTSESQRSAALAVWISTKGTK